MYPSFTQGTEHLTKKIKVLWECKTNPMIYISTMSDNTDFIPYLVIIPHYTKYRKYMGFC